ncbi:MAG: CDP-alcohol phosphatidyltransferase family protein [Cyclobacteriaceae bacterium]|nr:CDP-alcohol phosphatidyltransferase family protein [Cyclobacteriaceae bacterium]
MRLVNWISFFRVVAFPVFLVLLTLRAVDAFKWLVLASFLTDALDGYLARKFKVISILGSRLDSLGDDLAILAAFLGVVVFRWNFLIDQWILISLLWFLFLVQLGYAMAKYQKPTSFHTYGAKLATLFQGAFLSSLFFFDEPLLPLFYGTVVVTSLELIEEIIMVGMLPTWRSDVRGLYWINKPTPDDGSGTWNPE